jgi:hypothetical protein
MSSDDSMYFFDNFGEMVPNTFPFGLYDYCLIHCSIPYEITFKPILLDSIIHVTEGDFRLRDLTPETGMLEFKPDEGGSPYGSCDKIDVRHYDDLQ